MQVKLITKTTGLGDFQGRSIDEIIVGQARVSSSRDINELFSEPDKLLRHCILNQHWSIFELANLGFEITTSRAMGRELIRHGKMAGLTEFSQRYSDDIDTQEAEMRTQHKSNRQSSVDVETKFDSAVQHHIDNSKALYKTMTDYGIAKETARFVLPECTTTKIYMNFRVRELITFLNARLHKTAQKEIRDIALEIKDVFMQECPIISKSLFNFDNAEEIHILERIVLEKYKVYGIVLKNQ